MRFIGIDRNLLLLGLLLGCSATLPAATITVNGLGNMSDDQSDIGRGLLNQLSDGPHALQRAYFVPDFAALISVGVLVQDDGDGVWAENRQGASPLVGNERGTATVTLPSVSGVSAALSSNPGTLASVLAARDIVDAVLRIQYGDAFQSRTNVNGAVPVVQRSPVAVARKPTPRAVPIRAAFSLLAIGLVAFGVVHWRRQRLFKAVIDRQLRDCP